MVTKIQLVDFLTFLDQESVSYEKYGKALVKNEIYTIASIFSKIKEGFYFFTGENLPVGITDSLVLVREKHFQASSTGNNLVVAIDDDPQRIYYQFLAIRFGQKSNGVISSQALIGENVILGENVQIDPYVIVENNCIIGDGTIVNSFTRIYANTELGQRVTIESNCSIGTTGVAWTWSKNQERKIVQPQLGGVSIGDDCFVGSNTAIVRGSLNEKTVIDFNVLIAPGCKIGHGTKIGAYTHLANNITTGGNTIIGEYCFIGSAVSFRPKVFIADYTIIGTGAVVVKDQQEKGMTLIGTPAKAYPSKDNPAGMPQPKIRKDDI